MLTIKLLHVLLFVYWLGADVGTFYASRFVADSTLTPAARATAAKIMLGIDIAPRLCMPLVLGSGVHLASLIGVLPLSGALLAAVWLLCAAWLAMVLAIHHFSPRAVGLVRFDFVFRIVMVVALVVVAINATAAWLTFKVLCYAATIVCGLMIRVHLKPFGAAFTAMMAGTGGQAANATIASSISRCKPYVIFIWLVLVASAAAGLHLIF